MRMVSDLTTLGELKTDFKNKFIEVVNEIKSENEAKEKLKKEEAEKKAAKLAEKTKKKVTTNDVSQEDYEFLKKVGSAFTQTQG